MTAPIALSNSGLRCAWCLSQYDVQPEPNESHGICERHLAELKARVAAMRENKG